MARRFDQYYRVKPRDNLGDPDYWNRRFEDVDRRVSANEDGLEQIGGLTAYVEGLALNRLDLVLAPALDKITLVSEQGFLLAHSNSSVTLDVNTTQVFVIDDPAERELFAPSPFLTVCHQASMTDYAFARLVSYDKATGELTIQPVEIRGGAGPFDDWVIYVGTAISQAVVDILSEVQAARDTTLGYRNDTSSTATQVAADKAAIATMKADTIAARDAAQLAATNAHTWDPTIYSTTVQVNAAINTAIAGLVNSAPSQLDTINELAAALGNDANFSATITAALGNRLRFDAPQTLTAAQKSQAAANLSIDFTPYLQKSGGTMTGDLTVYRAALPGTGVVYLGNSGARYLFYDGASYNLNGAYLNINGATAWTSNHFGNPNVSMVTNIRLAYAADTSVNANGMSEPYGGAVMTGFGWASGVATQARFRYLQFLVNGVWYTAGYA